MPGPFYTRTIGQSAWFSAAENALMPETERHRETEVSDKKYYETTIGELRKTYGADFAMNRRQDGLNLKGKTLVLSHSPLSRDQARSRPSERWKESTGKICSIQDEQDQTCDQQNGHHPRYRENQSLRRLVVTCTLALHSQKSDQNSWLRK
jgi:hypothetical protein